MSKVDVLDSPNIVPLDYRNQKQVHAMAKLHEELLGGPIPQLGYQFMTKFYYSKLIKTELIKCDLYKHEDKYVAFSVYTKYPFTFMEEGKRRFFLYLCYLISKSVIMDPRRLKTIFQVMKMNSKRIVNKVDANVGDLISFGVLEKYAKLKDEATEMRISNLLFERTAEYFRKNGFLRMQGTVGKVNKLAIYMWLSRGAKITNDNWGGEDSYIVSYTL